MPPKILTSAALVCLLLALPDRAFSWGNEGHEIVAQIAARKLTPAAQRNIVALVRSDPDDDLNLKAILGTSGAPPPGALEKALGIISTWPDHLPGGRGPTGPWHYIDIGLFEGPSHMDERCPGGACITQKITELAGNLKTGKSLGQFSAPKELRFLVHFLGDIHQPLHCVTNADAGGNCVKEQGYDLANPELHALWDTGLVLEMIGEEPADTAAAIMEEFDGTLEVPETADPKAMAAETFEVARRVYTAARPAIPVIDHFVDVVPSKCASEAPKEITSLVVDARASYDNVEMLAIVRQQLYKAGVRLAAILNALPVHRFDNGF